MPRLPSVPGLTKQEARCVEALAYLEPGGWQSFHRLRLLDRAKEAHLEALVERGLVERRASVISTGRGLGPGTGRLWRLSPQGWALARECGWPSWVQDDDQNDYDDEATA